MARQREFNRDEVLTQAMETFWRKGYEATSIQDLVKSTGLNRGSLYGTFHDKRSLFEMALNRYEDTIVRGAIARLEVPNASMSAIVEHFHEVVESAIADSQRRGCLLVNSAIELCPHDAQLAAKIAAKLQRIEQAYYHALSNAVEKGEIRGDRDLHQLASFLVNTLQGLRVVSKVKPNRQELQAIVAIALSVLD